MLTLQKIKLQQKMYVNKNRNKNTKRRQLYKCIKVDLILAD